MSWRTGGAILTVLTLVAGTCSVWLWLLRGSETTSQTYHRSPSRLDFDFHNTTLMIEPGPPGQVRVERELTWSVDKPKVKESWLGDTLSVKIVCRVRLGSDCSVVYRIRVPADTELNARVSDGDVELRDLTGAINARADHGDIKLKHTAGDLTLENGSGNIGIIGSKSQRVDAQTGAGNVFMGFAAPPTAVTSVSGAGNIDIVVPPGLEYAVAAKTGAGNSIIDIGEDPASTRGISMKSGAGNVLLTYGPG